MQAYRDIVFVAVVVTYRRDGGGCCNGGEGFPSLRVVEARW